MYGEGLMKRTTRIRLHGEEATIMLFFVSLLVPRGGETIDDDPTAVDCL